jgi:lipid-binding SYLF domain-containing protein
MEKIMFGQMRTFLNALLIAVSLVSLPASAASKEEIDQGVQSALNALYADYPAAKALSKDAKGILVFPEITKVGMVVGGEGGDGALLIAGKTAGYYSTGGLSIGMQLGAQKYGYVLFFMTEESMSYLKSLEGWEVGVGPSIVVVDAGMAKNLTTTTGHSEIYAFIFGQKGLMAGIGLKGNKISKIQR